MNLQHSQETASATGSEQSLSLDDLVRLEPETGAESERLDGGHLASGAIVGTLVGLDESGYPLVAFPEVAGSQAVRARSTIPISSQDAGREVVLMFERGDVSRPLVLGLLQPPSIAETDSTAEVTARLDGERLVLTAEREIELKCGKASIVLTRAGKVLLRGAYVSSRSSGVNRIKGGSVQIN